MKIQISGAPKASTSATATEAADFVLKTFAKNGIKLRLVSTKRDIKDTPDLMTFEFDNPGLRKSKSLFALSLEGKQVWFDSLGSDVFNGSYAVVLAETSTNIKRVDAAKLNSSDVDKWAHSVADDATSLIDVLDQYRAWVKSFRKAFSQLKATALASGAR